MVSTEAITVAVVTDRRQIGASFANEDFYIKGMELEIISLDVLVTMDAGVLYHGSTRIEKSSKTAIRIDAGTDWWDGAVDTYTTAGWAYVGLDNTGAVKFIGDNPPNVIDTDLNTDGDVKRYWNDGSKTWRVIGAVPISNDVVTQSMFQQGDFVMWDVPQHVASAISDAVWSSAVDCSLAVPDISERAVFGLYVNDNAIGAGVWIRPNGTSWAQEPSVAGGDNSENGITVQIGSGSASISGQRECMLDSSQQIQYFNNAGDLNTQIDVEGFWLSLRD